MRPDRCFAFTVVIINKYSLIINWYDSALKKNCCFYYIMTMSLSGLQLVVFNTSPLSVAVSPPLTSLMIQLLIWPIRSEYFFY